MDGQDAMRGELAQSLLEVAGRAGSCAPITDTDSGFDLAAAYRVSCALRTRRIADGLTPVGWKIGFTNRTIWDEYDVHAPIWGPVYDSTVQVVERDVPAACGVSSLMEPRIEPEIVFRIAALLSAGMNETDLLARIDGVALGFELVQSPYPGWRFRAPDTVAAFALHGLLRHRPFVAVTDANRDGWFEALSSFTLALLKDGDVVDRGASENVLGGPLSALKAMVDGLPATALAEPVDCGAIVTTGTLTRAIPVVPGETWATRVDGLPLADIALEIVA
ncbi:2-keto-4-pentenoate hydratase [Stappia sp. ES.058]|uniref:2-keto-4-pentenoate hydratase n=1 Tax=Stappia sp. ES.058 TaxID=1881061 RepID=UPI00087D07A7|nr:hypothetical protein [Stappia sp. ES.058]SDU33617.1 2-oxo-3-hexenedioate decarboxylase [Stappia sp. ES.058]